MTSTKQTVIDIHTGIVFLRLYYHRIIHVTIPLSVVPYHILSLLRLEKDSTPPALYSCAFPYLIVPGRCIYGLPTIAGPVDWITRLAPLTVICRTHGI